MTLPSLVPRYVERAVPAGDDVPGRVRLAQGGEMWQKPGGRALSFTAVEELAIGEVAFSRRAVPRRSAPLAARPRLVPVGRGGARGAVLGLPVLRSRGPEVTESEAMRYLAELPWLPHAMAANQELEWRELDDATVEVATVVAPSPTSAAG